MNARLPCKYSPERALVAHSPMGGLFLYIPLLLFLGQAMTSIFGSIAHPVATSTAALDVRQTRHNLLQTENRVPSNIESNES